MDHCLPPNEEYLSLQFSPASGPMALSHVQHRWNHVQFRTRKRRNSNVRLRLELPPDHAETSAKHVSDDLPKMIFSKKIGRKNCFRKIFGRKFLVFRNFRWILEDLGGF